MTESKRLELIANAVANSKKLKVSAEFQGILDELKAEKMAEDLVLEHGLKHVTKDEVKEEFVSLDAVENDKDDDDFDNDENLVDMDCVSGEMLEAFKS